MIYLIVGNSGSGKTTQAKLLQEQAHFNKIVTYTTRPIRNGEINHIDYNFVNVSEFKELEKNNKLLGITNFSGNYYGIPKEGLNKYKNSKESCVLVIDLSGVKEIKNEFESICIYLKADEDLLAERMEKRNENKQVLKERLKSIQDFTPYADYTLDAQQNIETVHNEIMAIIKHLNN